MSWLMEKIFNLKTWQIFLLLSNYWIISLFVTNDDTIFLNIILLINILLVFAWYSLIIEFTNFILDNRLKFIYYFFSSYVLLYMAVEIIDVNLIYDIFLYLAIVGYLYIVSYVSFNLVRLEEKVGIVNTDFVTTYIQFFIYPIGIFFLHKRVKNLLKIKYESQ
jgi:hypothetical protein